MTSTNSSRAKLLEGMDRLPDRLPDLAPLLPQFAQLIIGSVGLPRLATILDEKTQELRDTGEPTADEIDEVLEEVIIAAARARSPDARPIIIDGDGAWEVLPVEKVPPGGTARFESTTDHELEVDRERLVEMAPFLAAALEVFDPSPTDNKSGASPGPGEQTGVGSRNATGSGSRAIPPTAGTEERPFG